MIDRDDEENEKQDDKATGPILEAVKKLFSVGVGAAFLTEESIRSYLADLKLPKDALNFILQSANKGKEELVNRVGKEIGALLKHTDFVNEVSKFASSHKFKISAEIEVIPKNKSHD
jgi:hypothetical protein